MRTLSGIRRIQVLGSLLVVFTSLPAVAAQNFLLELRAYENRSDGCTDCGCRLTAGIQGSDPARFWITFGIVKSDRAPNWEAESAYSYCGTGDFKNAREDFRATIGEPYLIADISIEVDKHRKSGPVLKADIQLAELESYTQRNDADYARSRLRRRMHEAEGRELIIPLFTAGSDAEERFQVHEVLLGLRSWSVPAGRSVEFGGIRIGSDVPGAKVLLDGGLAGRIGAENSLMLANVPEGRHEVSVMDFSERQASEQVRVKGGDTADLELALLNIDHPSEGQEMARIGPNAQGFTEYWRFKDQAIMVEIPAGTFRMGSTEGMGDSDEFPHREIQLPGFLIDKHEVTVRQFRAYAEAEYQPFPPRPVWGLHDNYPISFVLWKEAEAYCRWVGGHLPSEAEWEKAARGENGNIYPWGDVWDATRCNSIAGGMHRPESVGSYPRCLSPYGVLDMAGNVVEWTADWYAMYDTPEVPFETGSAATPWLKVMRGGGWMHQPAWLRTAFRFERSPNSRNMDHGFRCAFDFDEEAP